MLVRLACIAVTHSSTALRLISMSDHDKDTESSPCAISSLSCNVGSATSAPVFRRPTAPALAALLAPLPRAALRRLRLIVPTLRTVSPTPTPFFCFRIRSLGRTGR
ncbi:hypothetical protein ACFVZD_35805 [Streptomyces sp. NPDC058287]|uniref:hypothetical protein n=1 Tax=unclassified Streptomyces TaxID=2593676 RepID=UPI0036EBF18D